MYYAINHSSPREFERRVLCAICAALLFGLGGCSTQNDPHYNPYSSLRGGRPVTQRVEDAMNFAQGALDNLDARIENAGY